MLKTKTAVKVSKHSYENSLNAADVIGRLGVYTLDGSTDQRTLLQFVVNKDTLDSIVVVVVLDTLRPWLMLESLDHWMKALETHVASLGAPNLDDLKKKGWNLTIFKWVASL